MPLRIVVTIKYRCSSNLDAGNRRTIVCSGIYCIRPSYFSNIIDCSGNITCMYAYGSYNNLFCKRVFIINNFCTKYTLNFLWALSLYNFKSYFLTLILELCYIPRIELIIRIVPKATINRHFRCEF